jgi:hypothetical protein
VVAQPPDEIELANSTVGGEGELGSANSPAESGEEWFSAGELQRESSVELEGSTSVPSLGAVPSTLSCLEAWSGTGIDVAEPLALGQLFPGNLVWVRADPPSLAVDWAESLVDEVVRQRSAKVLYVVGEPATRVEARAWSRATGQPRSLALGEAASTAVKDPRWRAASAFRRELIHYFEAEGLVEPTDRLVDVADALRSWRRQVAEHGSSPPVLLVFEQLASTVPGATRSRLARLAREQSAALVIVGEVEGAEPSSDTIVDLRLRDQSVNARWSAPMLGERGEKLLAWNAQLGSISAGLPSS